MDSINENLQKENIQEIFESKETQIVQQEIITTSDRERPKNNINKLLENSNSLEQEINEIKQQIRESSIQQDKQIKKGLRSFQNIDDYICEKCDTKDKVKLLTCFTCKKLICKLCAEKESHYSSKRRDQSNYICSNCFEIDNSKIRKKQGTVMESNPNELNNEQSNNDEIEVPTSPIDQNFNRKKLREEDLEKKLEEYQKSPNKEVLDTDILHECFTPPSEIAEESNYTPRKGKTQAQSIIMRVSSSERSPLLLIGKKRRNLNNLFMDKICHHCKKNNPRFEYLRCERGECNNYYCHRCVKKYENNSSNPHSSEMNPFGSCYACRKICKCLECKMLAIKPNNNIVSVDLENLEENKNLVKIDDFIIVENEVPEEDDLMSEEEQQETFEIPKSNIGEPQLHNSSTIFRFKTDGNINAEDLQNKNLKNSVEYLRDKRKMKLNRSAKCKVCNKNKFNHDNFILTFKSLDELVNYIKYFLNKDENKNNTKYAISQQEFSEYYTNLYKKSRDIGETLNNNIKSSRYICKLCFESIIKQHSGLNDLLNVLQFFNNNDLKNMNTAKKIDENSKLDKGKNVYKQNENLGSSNRVPNREQEIKYLKESSGRSESKDSLSRYDNLPSSNTNIKIPLVNSFSLNQNQKEDYNQNNSNNLYSTSQLSDPQRLSQLGNINNFSSLLPNNLQSQLVPPTNPPTYNLQSSIPKLLELFNMIRGNQTQGGATNPTNPTNSINSLNQSSQLAPNISNPLLNSNFKNFNLLNMINPPNPQNSQNQQLQQNNNLINNSMSNNEFTHHSQLQNPSNNDLKIEVTDKEMINAHSVNPQENQTNINQNFSDPQSLMNSLSPDAMNVTNIIMNFDQNKNPQNINSYMNTVLEELRKQFFCIQYYSLIQKVFISYIFKHLEMFIEQIGKNQSLGEYVLSNMVNTLPKNIQNYENTSGDLQLILQNMNDQLNLLKNINSHGVTLTSTLNSNFEGLKTNGMKIFKAMDPNLSQSLTNNLNNLTPGKEGEKTQNSGNSQLNEKSSFDAIMNTLNNLNSNTTPTQLNSLINLSQSGQLNKPETLNKIMNQKESSSTSNNNISAQVKVEQKPNLNQNVLNQINSQSQGINAQSYNNNGNNLTGNLNLGADNTKMQSGISGINAGQALNNNLNSLSQNNLNLSSQATNNIIPNLLNNQGPSQGMNNLNNLNLSSLNNLNNINNNLANLSNLGMNLNNLNNLSSGINNLGNLNSLLGQNLGNLGSINSLSGINTNQPKNPLNELLINQNNQSNLLNLLGSLNKTGGNNSNLGLGQNIGLGGSLNNLNMNNLSNLNNLNNLNLSSLGGLGNLNNLNSLGINNNPLLNNLLSMQNINPLGNLQLNSNPMLGLGLNVNPLDILSQGQLGGNNLSGLMGGLNNLNSLNNLNNLNTKMLMENRNANGINLNQLNNLNSMGNMGNLNLTNLLNEITGNQENLMNNQNNFNHNQDYQNRDDIEIDDIKQEKN